MTTTLRRARTHEVRRRTHEHDEEPRSRSRWTPPTSRPRLRWATAVAPHVSTAKVGLELFCAEGAGAVEKIRAEHRSRHLPRSQAARHPGDRRPVRPARSPGSRRPYLTVHAAGGAAMIAAAVEALPDTRIAAVTVLTSLSAEDLELIGLAGPPDDGGRRGWRPWRSRPARGRSSARRGRSRWCGQRSGPTITLITPGVRPAGGDGRRPGADRRRRPRRSPTAPICSSSAGRSPVLMILVGRLRRLPRVASCA